MDTLSQDGHIAAIPTVKKFLFFSNKKKKDTAQKEGEKGNESGKGVILRAVSIGGRRNPSFCSMASFSPLLFFLFRLLLYVESCAVDYNQITHSPFHLLPPFLPSFFFSSTAKDDDIDDGQLIPRERCVRSSS